MKSVFIFLICLSFSVIAATETNINGNYILQLNQSTCIKHFVPLFLKNAFSLFNQSHHALDNNRIVKRDTNEAQLHVFDAYDIGNSFKAIGVRLNRDALNTSQLLSNHQEILKIIPDYNIQFDLPTGSRLDKRYYIRTSRIAAGSVVRADSFQLDQWDHDVNCPFAVPNNETRQFNLTTAIKGNIVQKANSKSSYKKQANAQWNLVRISEEKRDFTKPYVYDSKAGSDVYVYVIDDGMNVKHKQFNGRASWGWSAYSNISQLGEGHGTHVAGIIGGSTYGVAKRAKLIAVQVLDQHGAGSVSSILAGLQWVKSHYSKNKQNAKAIINMSLGVETSGIPDATVKAFHQALDATVTEIGIPVFVAAGNWGNDACGVLPAANANVYTVAASDINDVFTDYSGYGKCVQVVAPGEEIKSAFIESDTSTKILSGTSMATPHVSGAAALLLADMDMSVKQLYKKLTQLASKDRVKSIVKNTPNLLLFNGQQLAKY
ncbi:subtilisin-like protein [Backusella circina FSU 941]|nr:subtilisin-like protein [Backusella circina FSU 941]